MKRFLTALAIITALGSCTRQNDQNDLCSIRGNLNPVLEQYLAFTYGEFLDSIKIDKEGNFLIEAPVPEPGYGMLMYNNRMVDIYIEPGKSLEISFNTNTFPEKIEFKGQLGPVNHYSQLSRKLDAKSEIRSEKLFTMEPEAFSNFTDSIKSTKDRLLQEYVTKFPEIDSAFVKIRSADILYSWASQQLLYPGYYAILKNEMPPLPNQYHSTYLEKLDLNNHELLKSQVYKTFLENYLDYKEAEYLRKHPDVENLWFPGSVARFRVIHEEFSNQEIKNYALFRAMSDHLDDYGTEHIENFITNFRVGCTNEEYKELIEKKFSQNEALARGQVAPELEFTDKEGKKVKLSDLRGKMLYINFWASWSAWSIQEFPYWERLRNDFESEDLSFVCVSMDFGTDRNKWEYIIDKQKLGGVQLMQDPKFAAFLDTYFITDLPRYILIDKEGKIISAHAPRPSENMELVLRNLLNNK